MLPYTPVSLLVSTVCMLSMVHIWEDGRLEEASFSPYYPFHCWARKRLLLPVSLLAEKEARRASISPVSLLEEGERPVLASQDPRERREGGRGVPPPYP